MVRTVATVRYDATTEVPWPYRWAEKIGGRLPPILAAPALGAITIPAMSATTTVTERRVSRRARPLVREPLPGATALGLRCREPVTAAVGRRGRRCVSWSMW